MTRLFSPTYCRSREEQEIALAEAAAHPAAAQAHRELAQRYRSLAEGIPAIPLRPSGWVG